MRIFSNKTVSKISSFITGFSVLALFVLFVILPPTISRAAEVVSREPSATGMVGISNDMLSWVLPLIVTAIIMPLLAVAVSWGILQNKISTLKAEVDKLRTDVAPVPVMQSQLGTASSEITQLRAQNQSIIQQIAPIEHLSNQLNHLDRRLDWLAGAIQTIAGKVGAAIPLPPERVE